MVGRSGFKGLRPVYTGDFCCDFSAIFCTQLKLSQSLCSAQRADLFLSNLLDQNQSLWYFDPFGTLIPLVHNYASHYCCFMTALILSILFSSKMKVCKNFWAPNCPWMVYTTIFSPVKSLFNPVLESSSANEGLPAVVSSSSAEKVDKCSQQRTSQDTRGRKQTRPF